jgi:hypothetical protein
MAAPEIDALPAQLKFEREKWAAEVVAREREIAIKEREQQTREAELTLKRSEQARSQWTNPLTVAVVGAALIGLGNAIATWWNGRLQRVLEAERAIQQQSIDERRAESERILQVIKTGDPDRSATNLLFLLESGLIYSNSIASRLRDYLAQRKPGSGPSLPAPGERFVFDQNVEEMVSERIENEIKEFIHYVEGIGFPVAGETVRISIADLDSINAYYGLESNTITIDRRVVGDPYVPRREYMHHILWAVKSQVNFAIPLADIESGLADYFAASFANTPILGEHTAKVIGIGKLGRSYVRRLDNDHVFTERGPDYHVNDRGEMWGGAFWEIRDRLGRDFTDRLLVRAWLSMPWPTTDEKTAAEFVHAVYSAAGATAAETQMAEVTAVLERRKFPGPPNQK